VTHDEIAEVAFHTIIVCRDGGVTGSGSPTPSRCTQARRGHRAAAVAVGIVILAAFCAWDLICYAWVDERVRQLTERVKALEPIDDSPGHEAEMYDWTTRRPRSSRRCPPPSRRHTARRAVGVAAAQSRAAREVGGMGGGRARGTAGAEHGTNGANSYQGGLSDLRIQRGDPIRVRR
jgi:hypothetical protein